jgi:hypothetical protein
MFLGIVAFAAAVKIALPHPTARADQSTAWLLAGGVAGFLVGDLWFRAVLRISRGIWRALAVPLVFVTAVVGTTRSVVAQLAVVAAVLIAALSAEVNAERRAERARKAA